MVVTPQASNDPTSWNVRLNDDLDDDYGFVHALVAQLMTEVCVDPQRVYAAAHERGGLAGYLICSAPREFAAVAMVASTTLWLCPPEAQPSVLAIAGTADESSPYGGDDDSGGSVVEVLTGWAERNGCAVDPADDPAGAGCRGTAFQRMRQRPGSVVLMTIEGGTHQWPGTPTRLRSSDGNSEAGRKHSTRHPSDPRLLRLGPIKGGRMMLFSGSRPVRGRDLGVEGDSGMQNKSMCRGCASPIAAPAP